MYVGEGLEREQKLRHLLSARACKRMECRDRRRDVCMCVRASIFLFFYSIHLLHLEDVLAPLGIYIYTFKNLNFVNLIKGCLWTAKQSV